MGIRKLRILLNHAQRRVARPRIGVTCRGEDWREDGGLSVCPATGAVRLRANFEASAFSLSNAGDYAKLSTASYSFTDNNTPALTWQDGGDAAPGLRYVYAIGKNDAGAGAFTATAYPADQAWALGIFAYGTGAEQDGVLAEMGWSATGGDAGPGVRVYLDGRLEVFYDGQRKYTASLSGSAGYGRAAQEMVLISVERGRGGDMVIRTSKGGAATVRCDWVDPDDPASHMFPASKFWWYVPKGEIKVLCCPIKYETSGHADTRVYVMAEPPGAGETLQSFVGSDRFAGTTTAHVVGHPQGGDAVASLRQWDADAAFSPDGTESRCRIRLSLSTPSAVVSPWVWGAHLAYPPIVQETASAAGGIEQLLASPVRLSLPDSSEGLSAEFDLLDPEALDAIHPGASRAEGTPIRIELYDDEDDEDPVCLLDGEMERPSLTDSIRSESRRLACRAKDMFAAARSEKAREALPTDGMPMCRPVADGVSAAAIVLREMGFSDAQLDLPDLGYRLPDVPAAGTDRSPSGDWNLSPQEGDLWGEVLDRLFGRAPRLIYGCRPVAGGGYVFRAREPSDADPTFATLYRSVAAAQSAETGLTSADAERRLYDHNVTHPLPIEGNDVRVTGYDPGRRAPIAAVATWAESADPTLAPGLRGPGWIGRRRTVAYQDPGLTRMSDCRNVCQGLYDAVTGVRELDEYEAQLPFDADGIPLWRGDVVSLDDHQGGGEARSVRTASWTLDLADESGRGWLAGGELPPSRIARICGGALLGYGGAIAWDIVRLADARAKDARRYRGFGFVEGVSPIAIERI